MIETTRYRQIAVSIRQMIHQQRYLEAQELLPRFAEAVIEACNSSGREQEFLNAKEYLKSAIVAVRAQRAHSLAEFAELNHERAYLENSGGQPNVDVSG